VERSCDCAQKCNDDVLCKAWTHDGSKTCYLRRNKDGGYTLDHHVYGMTSGEKEVPTCGLFRNHWGNPWDVVADVERSCDCAQKCNDDVLCKAWTHDGSKTCYLRRNKDGGYTLDHHVYGMTSGEKVEEVPPAVTAVDLISPYHYTQYGQCKRELFCDTDTFDYCFSCIDGLCTAVEKCTYGGTNLSVWAPGPSCYPCALPRL